MKQSKLEFIKARINKKTKIISILVLFILLTSLFIKGLSLFVVWARDYTIVYQPPIIIKTQAPLEVISLTELQKRQDMSELVEKLSQQALDNYLNPQIVKEDTSKPTIDSTQFFEIIWKYESGKGTNTNPQALHMVCRKQGKWNEIGYSVYNKFCFNSKAEAELYVTYYLEKNCKDMSLEQALCRWNTGKATNDCAYAKGLLSLAN